MSGERIVCSYRIYMEGKERIRYHKYCADFAMQNIDRQIGAIDCDDSIHELNYHDWAIRYFKRFVLEREHGHGIDDDHYLYPSFEQLEADYAR